MLSQTFRVVGFRPVSTNEMYVPTAGKRRGRYQSAYFRSSDALRDWQSYIERSFASKTFLTSKAVYEIRSFINNMNVGLNTTIRVSMPISEYYTNESMDTLARKDTSNFLKSIEDAFFMNLGIDDKRTIKIIGEKGYNEDGEWYVEITIEDRSIHNRIDINLEGAYYE